MAITYIKDIPDFNIKVKQVIDINPLETTVSQLSASLVTVKGNVTEAQGDITTLAGAMTTANEEIDDIWKSNNLLGAKNLIPFPYFEPTETDRGITYTNNDDGTITVSAGTPEAGSNHVLVSNLTKYQPLEKDTKYILSCGYVGSEISFRLQLYNSGTVVATFSTSSGVVEVDTTGYTFDALQIQLLVTSTIANAITIYPMLRPADYQDSTFTSYVMTNKDLTNIVKCNQTTAGTYTLKATVASNGLVSYAWTADS